LWEKKKKKNKEAKEEKTAYRLTELVRNDPSHGLAVDNSLVVDTLDTDEHLGKAARTNNIVLELGG
jgi:hypothetical protein